MRHFETPTRLHESGASESHIFMKTSAKDILQLNTTLVRQILRLEGRVVALEDRVQNDARRIENLEDRYRSGIHMMEVVEHERLLAESTRQAELSSEEFKSELQLEYGVSQWAARMINEMLFLRTRRNLWRS